MAQISFKTKDTEARSFEYDLPVGLEALVSRYGEEAVAQAASAQFVISLQALARRHIEKSDDEITAIAAEWNPNERSPVVKKSAFERASAALANMSADEKAELLRRLQAA